MPKRKSFLLALICLASLIASAATFQQAAVTPNTADSLNRILSRMHTAADSIEVVRDLFDVHPRPLRDSIGRLLVDLALRANKPQIGLNTIQNLVNSHTNSESLMNADRELALMFPDSEDRKETLCLIDINKNYRIAKHAAPKEKLAMLDSLIQRANSEQPENIYDQIVMLHAICLNMANDNENDQLGFYLAQLESLIGKLRPEAYRLRASFLSQASLSYASNSSRMARGVKYDRQLLQLIDSLENGYIGTPRKFRNNDHTRYVIYARMLANFDSLSEEEVDYAYEQAMKMVQRNSAAAETNAKTLRPQIFHAIKHGEYSKALDMLQKTIDSSQNRQIRPYLLRLKIRCAQKTGDKDALINASLSYNKYLEDAYQDKIISKWHELEMIYDVARVKEEYMQDQSSMRSHQLWWATSLSIILLCLLLGVVWLLMHTRSLAKNLRKSNKVLVKERQSLREAEQEVESARDKAQLANRTKDAFIKNMTYKISVHLHTINEYTSLIMSEFDLEQRPYLKRYADLVKLQSEMVSTLINDLSVMADISTGSIVLSKRRENLKDICSMAIQSVEHLLSKDTTIHLAPDLPKLVINTDAKRLTHILWQLLSNAAKFTPDGTITVSYERRPDGKVAISVQDTGIGIPKQQRERIFDLFVKLDPGSQGAGIGLTLARQLAHLMGGDIVLEPVHNGSRFVILLP